jgi:phosphoribosyl 1,2-cyclic phosphodiesterase
MAHVELRKQVRNELLGEFGAVDFVSHADIFLPHSSVEDSADRAHSSGRRLGVHVFHVAPLGPLRVQRILAIAIRCHRAYPSGQGPLPSCTILSRAVTTCGLRAPASWGCMGIYFRSFRSSSAGNCLALWTADSSILIDCGVKTLRDCRALVRQHQNEHGPVHGVLVSHSHGDHLSRDAVRILQEEGIVIHGHRQVVPQLRERHDIQGVSGSPIQPFPGESFTVGDFQVTTIPLPHAPDVPNFGFVIRAGHGTKRRKVVVCTDFNDYSNVLPQLAGADFVFVEANHDLELLRQHFNPNSRYHLNNVKTAWLLCHAVRDGRCKPTAVMLGHLSEKRNRERLAIGEVERAFASQRIKVPFELETAPKFEPSRVITIG